MNTIIIDFYDKEELKEFIEKLEEKNVNYMYDEEDEITIEIYDVINFAKTLNRNNFYIELVNKKRDVVFYDIEDKKVYSVDIR